MCESCMGNQLLESVISDERPQFVVELTKKLNKILEIKTKLLMFFHLQIDRQTKNQELEQYLWFFVDHRQKDWTEWLMTVEFVINNKMHSVTKLFLFMVNYRRELKVGVVIRRKGKIEKATEFVKRIKRVQEEVEATLRKYLVFKKRLVEKLVNWYVSLYIINKIVSTNAVKLQLATSIKIHLVVNISWVVRYRKQVEEQKVEKTKLIKVDRVEI